MDLQFVKETIFDHTPQVSFEKLIFSAPFAVCFKKYLAKEISFAHSGIYIYLSLPHVLVPQILNFGSPGIKLILVYWSVSPAELQIILWLASG